MGHDVLISGLKCRSILDQKDLEGYRDEIEDPNLKNWAALQKDYHHNCHQPT